MIQGTYFVAITTVILRASIFGSKNAGKHNPRHSWSRPIKRLLFGMLCDAWAWAPSAAGFPSMSPFVEELGYQIVSQVTAQLLRYRVTTGVQNIPRKCMLSHCRSPVDSDDCIARTKLQLRRVIVSHQKSTTWELCHHTSPSIPGSFVAEILYVDEIKTLIIISYADNYLVPLINILFPSDSTPFTAKSSTKNHSLFRNTIARSDQAEVETDERMATSESLILDVTVPRFLKQVA
ncbi:hypothetical protein J6590_012039 [Homalodisca vitripennis]|nr:hypothetical protein J6590_012039 [Homalodisca vitripennis]